MTAFGKALAAGIPAQAVARTVLAIVRRPSPKLRYRVGAQATWLPRLRSVVPWKVYAAGVRKTFAI
jgi:hypothetical protein